MGMPRPSSRRLREIALDISVLGRQKLKLQQVAAHLEAAGFDDAAGSVSGLVRLVDEIAAARRREAEQLSKTEATAAGAAAADKEQKRLQSEERRKAQAARVPETVYRVVGNPDRQPVSPRAYAYGPCPDCGAPAGELCRAYRPPRGRPVRGWKPGGRVGWPHKGRIKLAREQGAFDDVWPRGSTMPDAPA